MKSDCPAWFGWVVLIVGVLYLLTDMKTIQFWNLSWYTVMFILWGLMGLMGSSKK
jgi:hypothetical protein